MHDWLCGVHCSYLTLYMRLLVHMRVRHSIPPLSKHASGEDMHALVWCVSATHMYLTSSIVPCRMEEMRMDCTVALRSQRMPTTRNEEYRFTDITPILQLEPQVPQHVCSDMDHLLACEPELFCVL